MGASINYSYQIVVSPNGQAAVMETISNPKAIVFGFNAITSKGLGGYAGWQISLSDANTPQDLAGPAFNFGRGGGQGWGWGVDVSSLGSGTQGQVVNQLTVTLGGGLGGYSHGASPIVTTVTPMCPR